MSGDADDKAFVAWLLRENVRLSRELDHEARRRDLATVYFIRCEQYVKIGISADPDARLKQIKKGSGAVFPRRLDIETSELLVTERGGFDRERELHAKFSHLRHTGEWFTEAPELTEYIESLGVTA